MFITFEGIDGSGKSSQLRRLSEELGSRGHTVVVTREPGGTPGAEGIRSLLLQGDPDRWSPDVELLMFTAARLDHVNRVVEPALAGGHVVLCDRYVDSTLAYQGVDPALFLRAQSLHRDFVGRMPDLTFLLDILPETGLGRAMNRMSGTTSPEDRFERSGVARLRQLRDRFLKLARRDSQRIQVIDADRDIDAVARDIRAIALERLQKEPAPDPAGPGG